jgi:hypothetical protein
MRPCSRDAGFPFLIRHAGCPRDLRFPDDPVHTGEGISLKSASIEDLTIGRLQVHELIVTGSLTSGC